MHTSPVLSRGAVQAQYMVLQNCTLSLDYYWQTSICASLLASACSQHVAKKKLWCFPIKNDTSEKQRVENRACMLCQTLSLVKWFLRHVLKISETQMCQKWCLQLRNLHEHHWIDTRAVAIIAILIMWLWPRWHHHCRHGISVCISFFGVKNTYMLYTWCVLFNTSTAILVYYCHFLSFSKLNGIGRKMHFELCCVSATAGVIFLLFIYLFLIRNPPKGSSRGSSSACVIY